MVLIHELLHAFDFGTPAKAAARDERWELEFATLSPNVVAGHWSASGSGFHRRSKLPSDAEVMQPTLEDNSHLTMASLIGSAPQLRYACETAADCTKAVCPATVGMRRGADAQWYGRSGSTAFTAATTWCVCLPYPPWQCAHPTFRWVCARSRTRATPRSTQH